MFGSVEGASVKDWWTDRGYETFGPAITSLRVTLVVRHRAKDALEITVNASTRSSVESTGDEFKFWFAQIQKLTGKACLLSNAPLAWSIYKSRITCDAINAYLDVFEAYQVARRNSKRSQLWKIGQQMRLNPKAMPKKGDSHKEVSDKHAAMGRTVSWLAKKGRYLVANAAKGKFPCLSETK